MNGITAAPTYPGPIFIVKNSNHGALEGNLKTNTSVLGGTRNIYVYNNTFAQRTGATSSGVIRHDEPAYVQNIVYKNNIFYASYRVIHGYIKLRKTYYRDMVYDYNLGYSTLPSGTIYRWATMVSDPLNNTEYSSLAAFRSATGQEAHGIWGDPLLNLNLLTGYPSTSLLYDLHLTDGSPAIDSGVVIPGINNIYTGIAPDKGAYEY
jgi:hypothetical protein